MEIIKYKELKLTECCYALGINQHYTWINKNHKLSKQVKKFKREYEIKSHELDIAPKLSIERGDYKSLIVNIIRDAVEDAVAGKHSAIEFINSSWCGELLEFLNIDHKKVIKAIKAREYDTTRSKSRIGEF